MLTVIWFSILCGFNISTALYGIYRREYWAFFPAALAVFCLFVAVSSAMVIEGCKFTAIGSGGVQFSCGSE